MLSECFEEIFLEVSIDEEQENGTLIIDLRKEISSLKNLKEYKIKFVRPCLNIYLNEKDKLKILSNKIDREEICPYENNCYLICKLLIEKEEIKLINLKINIKDINDHKPLFNKKFYLFNLLNKENSSIELEQAKDKDLSLENSIKNYYLNLTKEEENKFALKLNFNKEKHLLELILINNLQGIKKVKVELIVIDGKNEKDFCLIEINLLENEENLFLPPKFDSELYKFNIYNLNKTSFIGKVNAKTSLNKEINYRLISTNIYYFHLFEINSKTGEIYLKENENENNLNEFYELFIEAFYFNYISSLTTVNIYFNLTSSSFKENSIEILIPKLFQNSLNKNEIYLKENSSIPLTILQIFLSLPSNLQMKTSIDKNYFHLKQLDEQSFELILLKTIDYELIENISLNFISNLIKKSIEIIILNINDSPPEFNQTKFFFQIKENYQILPFLLYTFKAFDQDYLNDLTYEIQTNYSQFFLLNSTNGQLWILKSFDREIKSNYSFLICVFDQIYRTCSNVYLNILDENDNICYFNLSSINLTIQENLPSNTNLYQIQAFDSDLNENGNLFYSFLTKTSYLNINSTSGLIQTTTNSFDYEFIQSYSIIIYVCDNIYSFPSFCCSIHLFISIQDINDNLPFLIYPKSIKDLFIINYSLNKTLPKLKAFDNDIFNPIIFWNIIGGSLNSSISIDYYSGQLQILSSSSPILPIYGTLQISISSQTTIQLTILIHDNQTDPQTFQQSNTYFYSTQFFYIISFSLFTTLLFLLIVIICFFKQKILKSKDHDETLMNTPSTTTLSTRSISTSNHKKLYETYYSFGDSVLSPQVIHL